MPCLEVQSLVKKFGDRRVVNGLNLHVDAGEIVGLLGPNGAGKTTSFYMVVGLIAPDEGHVFFQDEDVTDLPMHARAQKGMGYLAQEPSIFRSMTVEENLLCILESLELENQDERLDELLGELHLTPLRKKKAAALSGGERRRLEITRALITEPTLLLLDEPFANIDPISVHELKHLVRELAHNKRISILITDHNAREIFSFVDRSYLVRDGKVMKSGRVDDLIHDPEVKRTYLGEAFRL